MTFTSTNHNMAEKLGDQHAAAANPVQPQHHVQVRDNVFGSLNQTAAFASVAKEDTKFGAEIAIVGLRKMYDQEASDDKIKIVFAKSGEVIITRETADDAVIKTMNIADVPAMAAYRQVVDKIREVTPEKFANGRLHTMAHSWIT